MFFTISSPEVNSCRDLRLQHDVSSNRLVADSTSSSSSEVLSRFADNLTRKPSLNDIHNTDLIRTVCVLRVKYQKARNIASKQYQKFRSMFCRLLRPKQIIPGTLFNHGCSKTPEADSLFIGSSRRSFFTRSNASKDTFFRAG